MPVMNKMRDSMPVVFAVLAGIFLLMIIFQWGGQGAIFNSRGDTETLGLVNGYKITQKDYNKILEQVTQQMKTEGKKQNLSEAEDDQAADKAWDQAVTQAIINQSIEKMGITVTDQDIRDQLFENPPPEVRRQFTDSMGAYHEDAYVRALRDPRNDSLVRQMETGTREQVLHYKWQAAMLSTIRVTDEEARVRFYQDSSKAMVQVVKFMPNPASEAAMQKQVTDKEIQDYYNSHTWMFKQDEERKFKFVSFLRLPTARDTALAIESANSIKARLADAPALEIDSIAKEMAPDYSDQPYQPKHLITMLDLKGDTVLLNAKPGDVAVVMARGKLNAVRVMNVVDTLPPVFHIRNILLGRGNIPATPEHPEIMENTDSVRAAAEQLLQQLRSGGNFAELARTRSNDPRSAANGGDYGWNIPGVIPGLGDIIPKLPMGEISGPFVTPRGVEIVQTLGESRKGWEVVSVPVDIKAGHQTVEIQQQMANIFHDQSVKQGFDAAAKNAGYHVVTDAPPASKKGPPIFGSHEFVDWIFDASKGDISQPFKLTERQFILVAQLTDITPEGPKPLDAVKPQIVQVLASRKAIAALLPRVQQLRASIPAGGDLGQLATSSGDSSLKPITVKMGPAESVNGLPTADYVINNWAYDQAKPGDISPAIKGQSGCYIVKLLNRNVADDKQFQVMEPLIVRQLFQEKQQRFTLDWVQNQKDKATIVDYRVKH
ncbi:MAG TPA: SurA N-terminal domain-containing protein [Candidatus Kapabacteria bacterium]|nr:SurA N-terminal domain-containing protein [Candidatus Kapabacteria bacterium]